MISFRIDDILREDFPSRSSSVNSNEKEKKRQRYTFSAAQVHCLEMIFSFNRYISQEKRSQLAIYLGLSEQQVKIWFQNRRYKSKVKYDGKIENQRVDEQPIPPTDGVPGTVKKCDETFLSFYPYAAYLSFTH